MEKLGNQFSGPIWVEMKFNWSHGHSTPKLVKVHGGQLGDTYFKPTPTNYRVVWQRVRNEDFFALRWGDPAFIREHIALNGQADHAGGYFVGSETYIPRAGLLHGARPIVPSAGPLNGSGLFHWRGGCCMTRRRPDAVFAAEFTRAATTNGAGSTLQGLRPVSETPLATGAPLRLALDFTLYAEGLLACRGRDHQIHRRRCPDRPAAMDPAYVSIKDFVQAQQAGQSFTSSQITPLAVADRLRPRQRGPGADQGNDARKAPDDGLRQEVADVAIWAHLALHLEAKIRGAIELQRLRTVGVGGTPANGAPAPHRGPRAVGRSDPPLAPALPRHAPHALQPQRLRGQPQQPLPLGADPRRGGPGPRSRPQRQDALTMKRFLLLASLLFVGMAHARLQSGEVHVWDTQEISFGPRLVDHANPYVDVTIWIDSSAARAGSARCTVSGTAAGPSTGALRRHRAGRMALEGRRRRPTTPELNGGAGALRAVAWSAEIAENSEPPRLRARQLQRARARLCRWLALLPARRPTIAASTSVLPYRAPP